MVPEDDTSARSSVPPEVEKHRLRHNSPEHTLELAAELIARFPLAMRAVLDLLAAIPPARWPLELEALQRGAEAPQRAHLAQALLNEVCGAPPTAATAVRAQITDERPAGGVRAVYQIGGALGSELIVPLDHLSAELMIAQHRVGLDDEGPRWFAVLRDLRALLNDPRVGALLDGPAAQHVG